MDFSNFDFDALDQATRDETLEQLSYPVLPDFDWDPSHPIDSPDFAWQPTEWQQTDWQQADASAYAPNEPQGALAQKPTDFQGQAHSPTMLVEFQPQFNSQETDQTHYNLVPWSGKVATQPYSSSPPDQKISRLETSKAEARDLNRAVEARAAKCCTWKDCPTTLPFADDADLERHLQSHAGDVIQRRSGDGGCTWSGCHSKAKFKLSALKLHLQNVHVKPLICVQPGCSFKRPFRSISDLQRHVHTKHSQTGVFRCPYKECRSSTRTFKRKDKWLEHVEDAQHQLDRFCPVQDCWEGREIGFAIFHNRKEVVTHMFNKHGGTTDEVRDFSCAIGGCKTGDPPFLTKAQLLYHLNLHHGFNLGLAQQVVDSVGATEDHELQLAHLGDFDLSLHATWSISCTLCSPQSFISFQEYKNRQSNDLDIASPRTIERTRRPKAVVLCCRCRTQHDPSIDFRCTTFNGSPHEFCNNCKVMTLDG